MAPRHLIDLDELPLAQLDEILHLADKIGKNPSAYAQACQGKLMATLFYEPSTRTQMSFQAAMLRLGGQVIGFDNPQNSSVSKGESLKDTVRVVSGYSDVVVIRNPMEGAAKAASLFSLVPVINAGDGGHLHPTQTLTDLATLYSEIGKVEDLCIGLCGDLKNGRTVHSLIKTMCRFPGNRFILVSTPELTLPVYMKDIMKAAGCPFEEVKTLEEAMPKLDVLYMTRIQQERFSSPQAYAQQKGVYVLDAAKMRKGKPTLRVLHPLPRVDEISVEVDGDPRAVYFRQTEYGMYARMALIYTILQNPARETPAAFDSTHRLHTCPNPRCITKTEPYLPRLFAGQGDMLVCQYCDERILV